MSMDKWINKLWYGHAMDYYTPLNREESLTHATAAMNLEDSMPSVISQPPRDKCCMTPLTGRFRETGRGLPGAGERRDEQVMPSGYTYRFRLGRCESSEMARRWSHHSINVLNAAELNI